MLKKAVFGGENTPNPDYEFGDRESNPRLTRIVRKERLNDRWHRKGGFKGPFFIW